MLCCCCWKSNQYHDICFASINFALIKRYHLHICNRVLLWFGKLAQWNLHVNGTTFQSDLRCQTGLSSLRVSCKRILCSKWICRILNSLLSSSQLFQQQKMYMKKTPEQRLLFLDNLKFESFKKISHWPGILLVGIVNVFPRLVI